MVEDFRKLVLTMALLIIMSSSVFFNIHSVSADDSVLNSVETLSMTTFEDVAISENGNAQIALQMNVQNSALANIYRTMLAAPPDAVVDEEIPIPENKTENMNGGEDSASIVIPVRQEFYKSIIEEQRCSFGFETSEISTSSMVPKTSDNAFRVSISAKATPQIEVTSSTSSESEWEIVIGANDEYSARKVAGDIFTKLGFAQLMLESLEGEQVYDSFWSTKIRFPEGAVILNSIELSGLKWTVSFGAGTFLSASLSLNDPSTIVLDERIMVTEQNFTAPPEGLYTALLQYKVFRINLTGSTLALGDSFASCVFELDTDPQYDWTVQVWSSSRTLTWESGPLRASMTVTSALAFSGHIGWGLGLQGLEWFEAWIQPHASVELNLEASASLSYSRTWKATIFSRSFEVTIWVLGFPVVVVVELSAIATLTLNLYGKVSVQVEVAAEASFKAGARWSRASGWSRILEASVTASRTGPTLTIEAGASVTSSLKFRVASLLYGLVGPFVEFEPYATAAITYTPPTATWELAVNFRINAGATFAGWLGDLLGLDDYSVLLYNSQLARWGAQIGTYPSSISINAKPQTIDLRYSDRTNIYGAVSSPFGGNKSGTVHIQYSADSMIWKDTGLTHSNSSGYYSLVWRPTKTGTYYLRSFWNGNSRYMGATSRSTRVIVSTRPRCVFGMADTVDVGNPSSEAGHDLRGWGPIEPATHGGDWKSDFRVAWYHGEGTSTLARGGVLTLYRKEFYRVDQIYARVFNRIGDDSFDVYVQASWGSSWTDWRKAYHYNDQSSIVGWVTHKASIPSEWKSANKVRVAIVATGKPWSGFETYGQLGIDCIGLTGWKRQ